jgi:hypothetical protein
MPENSGVTPISRFFGIPGLDAFYDSGMGGSQGISAATTHGQVVGTPAVSSLFTSSQVPQNRPALEVTAGDTSGMSDDEAVHTGTFLTPLMSDSTGFPGGAHPGHTP